MSVSEENAQEITEPIPVEEKVKKERSTLQKQVLEKARVKGLEVRLAKAADRKEAKEQALLQVAEKYRTKPAVVEIEKSEPEIEPEPEIEAEPEIETEVKGQSKAAELTTEKFQDPSELKPEPEPEPEKFEPPPPPPEPEPEPEPLYVFKNKRLTYTI
jgi:pilus assembly protein FimV